MQVNATFQSPAFIDERQVIQGLISRAIGNNCWVIIKDDKFYKAWDESAGQHSFEMKEEISEELYWHVNRLNHILEYLNKELQAQQS